MPSLLGKRQNVYNPYTTDNDSSYYWKEWAIFVGVIVLILGGLAFIRWHGAKRIHDQKPLLFFEKFMFARHFRNGPPYVTASGTDTIGMTSHGGTNGGNGMYGAGYGGGNGGGGGLRYGSSVPAPPPVYDPYAQALPVYQPKSSAGTGGEYVVDHEEVQRPGGGPRANATMPSTATETVDGTRHDDVSDMRRPHHPDPRFDASSTSATNGPRIQ